ncbi:VOC family protein [Novosphingobium album (ex Liu et al. 2023)]|uniref:VOC family protein n=1 Tax=Novosphingobium album (ex Liu et al. 2023) TaxID=3031130 RepID=A0ABT5WUE2_9SPHN|nr:VOC family protein [Novosphingobium album (ex Liu et al. 2023)]MDE8653492.1 VOC family protein [Novosphingobium album (ex Liu et al. 2023)]
MLEGLHYQNAYVCDDLEAAIDLFRGRGLRKEPIIIPVEQDVRTADGPRHQKGRICFIWIDNLQYELIEMETDEVGLYRNCLSNGGPLRFHHVCYRIDDWADFRARVDQQEFPVAMERDLGGDALKFLYLDARNVFGHYLEYTWMPDAMWEQIKAM